METRSSRHVDTDTSKRPKLSRAEKNKYLYDEVNKQIGYGEIDNFYNYEPTDLSVGNIRKREDIEEKKDIFLEEEKPKEKEEETEKVYDINSVLEEAKKNRTVTDDNRKRLQNAEYDILADLNKKYAEKKNKKDENINEEELKELIDTITSKTLPSEIAEHEQDDGKDLLSDLLATNTMNAINNVNLEEEIAKEILIEKENKKEEVEEDKPVVEDGKFVNSFYTKSMDLTEQDFELKEELEAENKAKRKIIILVVLIILVILVVAALYVLKQMNFI